MKPSGTAPRWNLAGAEVYRGNGLGMVLAGIATLLLVSTLLVPWWTYAGPDGRNDSVTLALSPGINYASTCSGRNCAIGSGSYTYSSTGLTATGRVFEGLETDVGLGLFLGVACFLVTLIAWVDRARLGAVRTAMGAALFAALVTVAGPIWLSAVLTGSLSADGLGFVPSSFSGDSASASWGPGGGWILAWVAAVLFLASAISEWRTLRYAKPWDAPLDERTPRPSRYPPPVTTPPDRLARLALLRQRGAITDADFEAQKTRILSPERLVLPVPIPPNAGSRKAAHAHLEYLRTSGRYTPEQLELQKANVLRAYGLSPSLLFPEEELYALLVRQRAGEMAPEEFERRKKEILDRI
jgi:hypothetical protein